MEEEGVGEAEEVEGDDHSSEDNKEAIGRGRGRGEWREQETMGCITALNFYDEEVKGGTRSVGCR